MEGNFQRIVSIGEQGIPYRPGYCDGSQREGQVQKKQDSRFLLTRFDIQK